MKAELGSRLLVELNFYHNEALVCVDLHFAIQYLDAESGLDVEHLVIVKAVRRGAHYMLNDKKTGSHLLFQNSADFYSGFILDLVVDIAPCREILENRRFIYIDQGKIIRADIS